MANKTLQFNTCEGAGHFPEPDIEKQRRLVTIFEKKNKHIVFKIIVFIQLLISEAISVTTDASRTGYFLAGSSDFLESPLAAKQSHSDKTPGSHCCQRGIQCVLYLMCPDPDDVSRPGLYGEKLSR